MRQTRANVLGNEITLNNRQFFHLNGYHIDRNGFFLSLALPICQMESQKMSPPFLFTFTSVPIYDIIFTGFIQFVQSISRCHCRRCQWVCLGTEWDRHVAVKHITYIDGIVCFSIPYIFEHFSVAMERQTVIKLHAAVCLFFQRFRSLLRHPISMLLHNFSLWKNVYSNYTMCVPLDIWIFQSEVESTKYFLRKSICW